MSSFPVGKFDFVKTPSVNQQENFRSFAPTVDDPDAREQASLPRKSPIMSVGSISRVTEVTAQEAFLLHV